MSQEKNELNELMLAMNTGNFEALQSVGEFSDEEIMGLKFSFFSWMDERFIMHAAVLYGLLTVVTKCFEIGLSNLILLEDANGNTPFMLALKHQQYEVASFLLVKLLEKKITPFFTTEDWLNMVKYEPSLISLYHQKKIHNLSKNYNIYEQTIYWYSPKGRSPSFVGLTNLENGDFSQFNAVKTLGAGLYGNVRLFENNYEQQICVKSLHKRVREENKQVIQEAHTRLYREFEFNKLVYPDNTALWPFEFVIKQQYTNRLLIGYRPGKTIDEFLSTVNCPFKLANIVYLLARELQRIHALGIIHGDLHEKNVLIDKQEERFIVSIIDFGKAVFMHEPSAIIYNSEEKGRHIASELCDAENIPPHVNQDVFSFGYLLKILLDKHPKFLVLIELFPVIDNFIVGSRLFEPKSRYPLNTFCYLLGKQLNDELRIYDLIKEDKLRAINELLNHKPDLLNCQDKNKYSPVFCAIEHNKINIVKDFIRRNVMLTHRNVKNLTPFQYALQYRRYEIINILLSKTPINDDDIRLVNGDVWLELITINPSMINLMNYAKKNKPTLLNIQGCHDKQNSISWFKRHGRRPSWFVEINQQTGESSIFKSISNLYQTEEQNTRLFENQEGERVCVKAGKQYQWHANAAAFIQEQQTQWKREREFFRKAYLLNEVNQAFFEFSSQKKGTYVARHVIRGISGETSCKLFPKIRDVLELAKIILVIVQEVNRIHELNILHNNLEAQFIVVNHLSSKIKVFIVDFSSAVPAQQKNGIAMPPNFNTDCIGLLSVFESLLQTHCVKDDLFYYFPSIPSFISNAMQMESLSTFCDILQNEIDSYDQRRNLSYYVGLY